MHVMKHLISRSWLLRRVSRAACLGVLFIGLVALAKQPAKPASRPAVNQSGRLVKSITLVSDAGDKAYEPHPAFVLKLNPSKLVLPGKAGVIHVKFN